MEQDFGVEHVPLIPSLFWSLHVLGLDNAISDEFEKYALDLTMKFCDSMPFASKVLLN